MRYFCGTSDTSKTTNSSDSSRTGASVTRLSSYMMKNKCFKAFLTNIFRGEGGISPMLLLFFSSTDVSSKEVGAFLNIETRFPNGWGYYFFVNLQSSV